MKDLWELVQVYNVNVGDVIMTTTYELPATIDEGQIDKYGGIDLGDYYLHSHDTVFRRIPETEDPRVLRRALDLMERLWLQGMGLRNPKYYIEKARKEFESESGE